MINDFLFEKKTSKTFFGSQKLFVKQFKNNLKRIFKKHAWYDFTNLILFIVLQWPAATAVTANIKFVSTKMFDPKNSSMYFLIRLKVMFDRDFWTKTFEKLFDLNISITFKNKSWSISLRISSGSHYSAMTCCHRCHRRKPKTTFQKKKLRP